MKSETIKAIFTNLLFVIGVSLAIFGFTHGVLTATRLAVFSKYPLNSYEEIRCDQQPVSPVSFEGKPLQTDSAQTEAQKQKCLAGLEDQRNLKKVEDIATSISTLVAGGVLIFFFRRFILK